MADDEQVKFTPEYPPVQKDPFPKMIIVCGVITVVLFFVIFMVLIIDFIQRRERTDAMTPRVVPVQALPASAPAPAP